MFLGPSKTVVGPTEEPVTLAEAKTHLRVDHDADDTLIMGLIATARRSCEFGARRSFVTQTREMALCAWPPASGFKLPMPPLQSVESITYLDEAGATHTVTASDYRVYTNVEPGIVALKSNTAWPSATLAVGPSITVRYVAGYGLASAVPDDYKSAMLLMIGHLYENREAVITGTIATVLPMAVASLLKNERVDWF